jgi:mannose-6-phosphate isomerase-like protein (cupin superfamily)
MDASFPTRITPTEAAAITLQPGRLSALVGRTADVEVRHYAPLGSDQQTPHDRDELYVVISGRGKFRRGDALVDFAPGDLLFCEARVAHRFEDFTDDFACWVVFFGPALPGR